MKTKIKSHDGAVSGYFKTEIPKVGSKRTSLVVITLDSALKNENYYLQEFLKECKYTEKEKKSG